MYTYLMTKSQSEPGKIDPKLLSIERRSLNVMRRLCVADLIPEFVYLIDKLDNRHCYRWIEKSLEFYCKYTINAIEIDLNSDQMMDLENGENQFYLTYSSVNLLQVIYLFF
jgi:hypothetical protein